MVLLKVRTMVKGSIGYAVRKATSRRNATSGLRGKKGRRQSQDMVKTSLVKDDANDLVGLLVAEVNLTTREGNPYEWVLNTTCYFHITSRKNCFINMRELSGKVRMTNNTTLRSKGLAQLDFLILMELLLFLTMYDSCLISQKLISVGTLGTKGVSSEEKMDF